MYFYRDKGLFLQRLHPVTVLLYTGVLLGLTVLYDNPLFLLSLLGVVTWTILELDGIQELRLFGKVGLVTAGFITVINPLLSREGATILWTGPQLPVLGHLDVSLEAVIFGLVMGLRVVLLLAIFCFYNLVLDPDKSMSFLGRFTYKSAITLALTVRLLPSLANQIRQVAEIQKARGVDFDHGSLKERLKKRFPFLKVMLLSSLEGSWHLAEAMEARALGSGKPTSYNMELWRPRDYWILVAVLITTTVAMFTLMQDTGKFTFYPRVGPVLQDNELAVLIGITMMLAVPPALAKGCRAWKSLAQKL